MRVILTLLLLPFLRSFLAACSQYPFLQQEEESENDALIALHRILVSIPSTSGNESAIAFFLRDYLKTQHLEVELQPVVPEAQSPTISSDPVEPAAQRYNVFAHPPGQRQTPVLLTSHIDTVPPHIPYSLRPPNEIWGRGTVDAKACVATQIMAYSQLVRTGAIKADDVSLLFVVGEETGGVGMRTANGLGLAWKTVIFGEPTELKLASGHKGFLVFYVTTRGAGGHSGYPELAESALDVMLVALAKLKQLEPRLPSSERFGATTVNIGMLESGDAPNVIPKRAVAGISVRIASEKPEAVKEMLLKALDEVDGKPEVQVWEGMYGPVAMDHDVPGFDTIVVKYGTDVPNLHGNHKKYLYGPGSILVAHSDHEHLRSTDLIEALAGYKRLIRHALQK